MRHMKRVINGKFYNTETAELVADAESSAPYNDMRYWYERLYKTRRGAWFVAGEGGAMSYWSESCGSNLRGPGSGIILKSEGEALEWCEQHEIDPDVVARHFELEEG